MIDKTGLIHIYYGNGKGKTTTGMGLITRAAGYGYRVLLYQFMKNNKTSERKILEKVPNITIVDGLEQEKFSFQMTEEEKAERRKFYNSQFQMVTKKAAEEHYDVLFMDETIYTISAGLLDEQLVLDFLASKPENLEVIEQCGGKPVEFSLLYDETLPEGAKGLILGGGYPELYAEELSANTAMRLEIQKAIREGMPCLAECGGFLYLQEELEDVNGKIYPMAGVIRGVGYPRRKLTRFGYLTLTVEEDTLYLKKGEQIRGHEFHYWETTDNGDAAIATKPDQSRSWACVHAENRLFAGFPHLAYSSCPEMIRRFIEEAGK